MDRTDYLIAGGACLMAGVLLAVCSDLARPSFFAFFCAMLSICAGAGVVVCGAKFLGSTR